MLGNQPWCLCKCGYILFEAAAGSHHLLLSPSSLSLRPEHRTELHLSGRSGEDGVGTRLGAIEKKKRKNTSMKRQLYRTAETSMDSGCLHLLTKIFGKLFHLSDVQVPWL